MPGSFQNNCNSISTDPALAYVDAGHAQFTAYAADGYALAVEQTTKLNDFNVDYITWNAQFDADGVLGGFVRPARPDINPVVMPDMTVNLPAVPSVYVPPIVLDAAPAEPADLMNPPAMLIPTAPGEFDVAAPGDAPVMATFTLPDAPTLDTLLPPALLEIIIPSAPVIDIGTFDEPLPLFEGAVPDGTFDFTERMYESDFIDEIKAKLSNWIATDGRVPAQLSDALWGKATGRLDSTDLKMHQEARDKFSSRGFDEPNGILTNTLLQVQQANRDARAGVTRDIYIQEETLAIENLKFAVQQGLQLELTYMQAWLTIEQRRFELVSKVKEAAIAVFNAHVQMYNVSMSGYNARVEAYKAHLESLRMMVAVYESQVSAARVTGEINNQLTQMYATQIQAQGALVDVFRGQIEGFKARIDGERAIIDGYRAEVEAYQSRVEAHGQEWQAYNYRLQAEVEKGRMYSTMVDAFGKRTEVWQTKSQVKIQENQANLQTIAAQLQQYDAQIKGALAKLEAGKISVDAQVAVNNSLVSVYEIDSKVESTAVDADTRIFAAQTERENTRLQVLLKDAELQLTQMLQRTGLLLEAFKSAGASSSQLAAAAFSAVNYSASISSSKGNSESCSTNFSFSGEIIDS